MTAGRQAAGCGPDPVLAAFRGAVMTRPLTDEDLERLDAGSTRRGVKGHTSPRPLADEQQLQAYCEWLHGHGLNIMGVVTFTDRYADLHGLRNRPDRALDAVWHGLTHARLKFGTDSHKPRGGYPWKFVLAAEWHKTGRDVPHVHLALESRFHDPERVCDALFAYCFGTFGRSRFEPMRDTSAATLYGLKDTVKVCKEDPSMLRLRLWHPGARGAR